MFMITWSLHGTNLALLVQKCTHTLHVVQTRMLFFLWRNLHTVLSHIYKDKKDKKQY